jgi:hypothetical protein
VSPDIRRTSECPHSPHRERLDNLHSHFIEWLTITVTEEAPCRLILDVYAAHVTSHVWQTAADNCPGRCDGPPATSGSSHIMRAKIKGPGRIQPHCHDDRHNVHRLQRKCQRFREMLECNSGQRYKEGLVPEIARNMILRGMGRLLVNSIYHPLEKSTRSTAPMAI